jgi:hypothetical protein
MIKPRHLAFLLLALAASVGLFSSVIYWGQTSLTSLAAGPIKAILAVTIWYSMVYYGLDIDTAAEWGSIKADTTALAIILLSLAILIAPSIASGQPLVDTAKAEEGVTEHPPGSDEGERIAEYMAAVGLSDGVPWCAGFTRWSMDRACVRMPAVRSAAATDYITKRSIEAKTVLRGGYDPQPGDLVIHRRGDSWKGHIGIVVKWGLKCGTTVSGNTSGQDVRNGDTVAIKRRCIKPLSYFRIVAFTPLST